MGGGGGGGRGGGVGGRLSRLVGRARGAVTNLRFRARTGGRRLARSQPSRRNALARVGISGR